MSVVRRRFLKGIAGLAGFAAVRSDLSAPAIAQGMRGTGQIAVYDGGGAWGEAKRIALFEPFERETGIKVIAQPRTDLGATRASILSGAPRYDVTILTGGNTGAFERENLLLPVDLANFEKSDLDSFKPVRPGKFTVPHIVYSLLIAYDKAKYEGGGPNSWADVWNTSQFPGGRSLATGTRGPDGAVFEAALLADGVDPPKLYPLDWDRAFRSLSKMKPHVVKWWNSGAEGPQLIVDRQVAVGSAWNGRIVTANDTGERLGFTWDQGILQYDSWVILKGTKNLDGAQKFLAFASRAEVQANFVKHILYAPPNSRAFDFIAPQRAKLLPTAPELRDRQIVQNYEFWNSITSDGRNNSQIAVARWERWLLTGR